MRRLALIVPLLFGCNELVDIDRFDIDPELDAGPVDEDAGDDSGVDGGCTPTTYFRDEDEDGVGDDSMTMLLCDPIEGFVETGGDCDDTAMDVFPGADELCDGVDQDCDTAVDEGLLGPIGDPIVLEADFEPIPEAYDPMDPVVLGNLRSDLIRLVATRSGYTYLFWTVTQIGSRFFDEVWAVELDLSGIETGRRELVAARRPSGDPFMNQVSGVALSAVEGATEVEVVVSRFIEATSEWGIYRGGTSTPLLRVADAPFALDLSARGDWMLGRFEMQGSSSQFVFAYNVSSGLVSEVLEIPTVSTPTSEEDFPRTPMPTIDDSGFLVRTTAELRLPDGGLPPGADPELFVNRRNELIEVTGDLSLSIAAESALPWDSDARCAELGSEPCPSSELLLNGRITRPGRLLALENVVSAGGSASRCAHVVTLEGDGTHIVGECIPFQTEGPSIEQVELAHRGATALLVTVEGGMRILREYPLADGTEGELSGTTLPDGDQLSVWSAHGSLVSSAILNRIGCE